MKPYQERVIKEQMDLDDKCLKLSGFISGNIYSTLDKDEQLRLNRQLESMATYSNILTECIAAFTS